MSDRRALRKAVRILLAEKPKLAGESDHEAALALHLKGEASRWRGVECNACHDQSWRRAEHGCVECGKPYAPERAEHAVPDLRSSIGLFISEAW